MACVQTPAADPDSFWDRDLQSAVEGVSNEKPRKDVWVEARVVDALRGLLESLERSLRQSVVSPKEVARAGAGSAGSGSGDSGALLDALLKALQASRDGDSEEWTLNDLRADLQRAIEETVLPLTVTLPWFLAFADLGIECEEDPELNVGKGSAAGPTLTLAVDGDETTWAAQDVWD